MAAGTIARIRLENFMCHSSLQIELGSHVNFITGQNGSGKSAIVTAVCVAFGCRAKNTQRAASLKDFMKTGCSYAAIIVDINNNGDDALKPELYGNLIILERRINESCSSTVLKDQHGRKVAHRKDDLNEIIEHFNIDVDNPCVIMSQEKSREFLHSGNDKDKFKFFFKATLLQQVKDLLDTIRDDLSAADSAIEVLEDSIRPVLEELDEIRERDIESLKKKLAWSWVYGVDKKIEEQETKLQKCKERIRVCQERIDHNAGTIEELTRELTEKKENLRFLVVKTQEVTIAKGILEHDIFEGVKLKRELEKQHERGTQEVNKLSNRAKQLQAQARDFKKLIMQATQAEASQIEEDMQKIEQEINVFQLNIISLKEEENELDEALLDINKCLGDIGKEIGESASRFHYLRSQIIDLHGRQGNKMLLLGDIIWRRESVRKLLKSIEKRAKRFQIPPIGPIGVHVQLASDFWSVAVDCALGRLLDAFIVSCHKDLLLLRDCAKEADYCSVQIIIYDFAKPRLNVPAHCLPSTTHPTIFSVIHSESPTVLNVLIDMGHIERQVLVQDYEVGKSVAFDHRIRNLKEVYTSDGLKMFSRGSAQTIILPNRNLRAGRLCTSLGERIAEMEREATEIEQTNIEKKLQRTKLVHERKKLECKIDNLKRKRDGEESFLERKKVELDNKKLFANNAYETGMDTTDIETEMTQLLEDIKDKKLVLQEINAKLTEALKDDNKRRASYKEFIDNRNIEMESMKKIEDELNAVEEKLHAAKQENSHYEVAMENKGLADVKNAESQYADLQQLRQENFKKASSICSESEVQALGGVGESTPEQLSAHINKLNQRFQRESRRYVESIDDLRALHDKKERKIQSKQQMYAGFRDKLNTCQIALELRWKKFRRNASLLKRQLTWLFNEHLGKKGISGHINVDYNKHVLSIEITMPHDASRDTVRDTRGLSGGERSFSTLCFNLALHGMTEAPLRAMDEFDVFMDAVSRKISLDTLVDFAVEQGSQWIFLTPHDISMVKPGIGSRSRKWLPLAVDCRHAECFVHCTFVGHLLIWTA